MRNKVTSSMQKTYDECYLICSTAVYFEGKNNESEALRSWKSALDQIYYHNAYRVPANYQPKNETEKALQDSLRELERQCKERVELLEALKLSRIEAGKEADDANAGSSKTKGERKSEEHHEVPGFIGEDTIPAINYPELSKVTPPLSQRPNTLRKKSSDTHSSRYRSSSYAGSSNVSLNHIGHVTSHRSTVSPQRSPSPEKKGHMRMTLRDSKDKDREHKPRKHGSRVPRVFAASKAAGLAWDAMSRTSSTGLPSTYGDDQYSIADPASAARSSLELYANQRKQSGYESGGMEKQATITSDEIVDSAWRDIKPQPSVRIPSTISQLFSPQASPVSRTPDELYYYPNTPLNDLQQLSISDPASTSPHASFYNSTPIRYDKDPSTASLNQRKSKTDARHSSHPLERRPHSSETISSVRRKPITHHYSKSTINTSSPQTSRPTSADKCSSTSSAALEDPLKSDLDKGKAPKPARVPKVKADSQKSTKSRNTDDSSSAETPSASQKQNDQVARILKALPKGVDVEAAKQIMNEIVVHGDEVHWDDVAGLDVAKTALKETVVYPFLRPDLFMGLREPARGMLLFGPPGTGKTMLARAVATESMSTFFAISASSLTSKWLGESEKLVRALFALAKALAPSIIFVDEIDSLLSARSNMSEHETTRRIKTEFLIQWSDLQRAAAGRDQTDKEKKEGDASRVLVLAATNLPWAIDEAARRRFVRRQYIPLPEDHVRATQLRHLLSHQKHSLVDDDIEVLVRLTEGFSGSDITALAKDAAMGPLRSLGEALLHMSPEQIRPITFKDFEASLLTIRASVSKEGLKKYEDWAKQFGERGG